MSEKYVVTWDMFPNARPQISRTFTSLQHNGKELLLSVMHGLFPAAVLARELGLRHVDTVCISS